MFMMMDMDSWMQQNQAEEIKMIKEIKMFQDNFNKDLLIIHLRNIKNSHKKRSSCRI